MEALRDGSWYQHFLSRNRTHIHSVEHAVWLDQSKAEYQQLQAIADRDENDKQQEKRS